MKEFLIKLLGGYTTEEYNKMARKAKDMQHPLKEEFKVGDRIWFYYVTVRAERTWNGFYTGVISKITNVDTSSGQRVEYSINTSGERHQFEYDFKITGDEISKDIFVLRKKLLLTNGFLPVQKDTIRQDFVSTKREGKLW